MTLPAFIDEGRHNVVAFLTLSWPCSVIPSLVVAFMVVGQVLHNGLESSSPLGLLFLALAIQLLLNGLLSSFVLNVSGVVCFRRRIHDLPWNQPVGSLFDLIAIINLDGTL